MMELHLDGIVNSDLAGKRYGSCWTMHKGVELVGRDQERVKAVDEIKSNGLESMWKTYCRQGGVRIKSTLRKVRMVVKKYCDEHNLTYQDKMVVYEYCESPSIDKVDQLCFSKSPNFYTDDEYRFIINAESGDAEGLNIVLDNVAHFVDEVLVSPPVLSDSVQLKISQSINDYFYRIGNTDFSLHEVAGGSPLKIRRSVLYGRWQP